VASKDRRGERGKRPDIMFIVKHEDRIYELIFAECSRIICGDTKKDDDRVKLWRELNDGLYWANRGLKMSSVFLGSKLLDKSLIYMSLSEIMKI
jgi:hypothetical protein